MIKIATILFMNCINSVIPNPFTVEGLPTEQRQLIREYAEAKCKSEVMFLLEVTKPDNNCVRGDKDCL